MNRNILIILFVFCFVLFSGCQTTADDQETYIDLSSEEFDELISTEDNYLLLDVRTQEEYDEGHFEGALLIPNDELEERVVEIEEYEDQLVIVYCRSGNRSSSAAGWLVDQGFTDVYNLETGLSGYNQ
jgi:rhodanese-related sulfurtransferase